MGEYPPTGPTSWGDLASPSLDPPSSPRQCRHFSVLGFSFRGSHLQKVGPGGTGRPGLRKGRRNEGALDLMAEVGEGREGWQ